MPIIFFFKNQYRYIFLHHSITRGIKVCFPCKYAKCFSLEGSDQGVGVGPWASLDGLMLFGGVGRQERRC